MITLRLGARHTEAHEAAALAESLKKFDGACDNVWLQTLYGYPTMEEHKKAADNFKKAAKIFRDAGIEVSFQVSNTIGHGEYMKSRSFAGLKYPGSKVQYMVGPDGAVSPYCFCWFGEQFRQYIYESVQMYAEVKPESVWIDDDLRGGNHAPVEYGCYCDDCIARFNTKYGSNFSREELVNEINYGDVIWRERYIEQIRQGMAEVAAVVTKAVHSVSPETVMAYQTARDTSYTGSDMNHVFDKMKEITSYAPRIRPGGGFYCDKEPRGMIKKALLLNYTNNYAPDYVVEKWAEVENTPDVMFGKSMEGMCKESSLYLAYGCTGLTYAAIMSPYEHLSEYERIFKWLSLYRPFWEKIVAHNRNTSCSGVCVYPTKDGHKKPLSKGQEAFSWCTAFPYRGKELATCGIPISHDTQNARVYMIDSEMADYLSDEDIEFLLAHPVVTDGHAVQKLLDRGYENRIPLTIGDVKSDNVAEYFSSHAVCGKYAGDHWEESFFSGVSMKPCTVTGGEPLGEFVDNITQEKCGQTGSICQTFDTDGNPLSKWAVFGYCVWKDVISSGKRYQILHAIDAVSNHSLPAILENNDQMVVIPRADKNGKTVSVALMSCCIGESEELILKVRNPIGNQFSYITAKGTVMKADAEQKENEWIVKLPSVGPWEMIVLLIEQ